MSSSSLLGLLDPAKKLLWQKCVVRFRFTSIEARSSFPLRSILPFSYRYWINKGNSLNDFTKYTFILVSHLVE